MSNINLDNYETVNERLLRFKKDNPNFRMESNILDMSGGVGRTRWIVKVDLWRDSANDRPDSSGHAFEIDGRGTTQKSAALETCETSALGRALANLGYVGDRRATREEMVKVKNNEVLAAIDKATSQRELEGIYASLKRDGLEGHFLADLTNRKRQLEQLQQPQGDSPSTGQPGTENGTTQPGGQQSSGGVQ